MGRPRTGEAGARAPGTRPSEPGDGALPNRPPTWRRWRRWVGWDVAVAVAALLPVLAILFAQILPDRPVGRRLAWVVVAMSVLVVARQTMTLRENLALGRGLEAEVEAHTAELRRSEERFRSLLQYSSDVVLVLSAELVVQFVTDASGWILGYVPEDLLGTGFLDLVPPEERDGMSAVCARAMEKDGRGVGIEHRTLRPDGSWASCESVVVSLLGEPSVAGLVVTVRDMTARLLLEAELAQAQRLESVGRLAAGVAHEINTPVQYVGDNVRFLEEALSKLTWLLDRFRAELGGGQDSPVDQRRVIGDMRARLADDERSADIAFFESEAPEAVKGALEGVERVARIVKAMKGIGYNSQSERGPVEVVTVLEDALVVTRSEYKHLAVVETDFEEVPPILGYAGELSQVFLNLIVNAAHAIADRGSGEPGRIRVRVRGEGDVVVVDIEDNGCGIPEQDRAKIFDQFFTTKEIGRGTGQGLALARGVVVNKHGGELSFTSEVGRGTVFSVLLPVEPAAMAGSATVGAARSGSADGGVQGL